MQRPIINQTGIMAARKPVQLPLPDESGEELNIAIEKLFDRQDLLQMFHISVRTLQYWRSKGILSYSKIGNKIYYRQRDVEQVLKKNRMVGGI